MTVKEKPKVGIGVLIFDKKERVLLGKRKNSHGNLSWAPPGGHLEFGEEFEDCAIREVEEETGVTIASPKLFSVTNDFFKKDNKHYVSIIMKAIFPEGQEIKNLEPHKTDGWNWFSLDDLPENLFLPLKKLFSK